MSREFARRQPEVARSRSIAPCPRAVRAADADDVAHAPAPRRLASEQFDERAPRSRRPDRRWRPRDAWKATGGDGPVRELLAFRRVERSLQHTTPGPSRA